MTRAAAQTTSPMPRPPPWDGGTPADLFPMLGCDSDRSGLVPRANLDIGIGPTFAFSNKDPIGDELRFACTSENAGTRGLFHTDFGSRTEALGVIKNFNLPKTKDVTGYTWIETDLGSFTGYAQVENRFLRWSARSCRDPLQHPQPHPGSGIAEQDPDSDVVDHNRNRLHMELEREANRALSLTLASADSPIGRPHPSAGSPTHRSCRSKAGTPARAHNRDSKSHPQPACPTPAS
jgi:hypothetical protein